MLKRREQIPLEASEVIRVIDIYGRKCYILAKNFKEGKTMNPIYRKYKGLFFRDAESLCLHKANIREAIL